MIVSDYTDREDTIVAALLHDTLEDTDYTEEEIHEDFGPNVRDIVITLTKPPMPPETPWKDTRNAYLKKLKDANEDALIVAAADKLHNMRTMVEAYYDMPEALVNDFGGSLNERLMLYQEISNIFNRKLTNPITHEFNHVFEEFKQFILHAQSKKDEESHA
jgi:(p)ppGpp synthase/HD superfamily hydrolase